MTLSNLANHIEKRQTYLRRREAIKAAAVEYADEVGIPEEKRAEFFTALTADVDAQKSAFWPAIAGLFGVGSGIGGLAKVGTGALALAALPAVATVAAAPYVGDVTGKLLRRSISHSNEEPIEDKAVEVLDTYDDEIVKVKQRILDRIEEKKTKSKSSNRRLI